MPLPGSLISLLAISGTVISFALADRLHKRTNGHPLTHPVLLSIAIIGSILLLTGIPYASYFGGAYPIHFLLGPATVALALPLYQRGAHMRESARPIGLTLVIGSLIAMGLGAGFAYLSDGSNEIIRTLIPKSVTTPVAIGLAEELGTNPSLTAALVILTGTVGAVFGPPILDRLVIRDDRAKGFALGLVSHGIGTAQAFRISTEAGVFASLGMGLNAVMTTFLVALIVTVP